MQNGKQRGRATIDNGSKDLSWPLTFSKIENARESRERVAFMVDNPLPQKDGDCLPYHPTDDRIRSLRHRAKFFYVNGIRTDDKVHKHVAEVIANLTESTCHGVFNASGGALVDLQQCLNDWVFIFRSQVGEQGFFSDRLTQSAIDQLTSVSLSMAPSRSLLHALREAWIVPKSIRAKRSAAIEKIHAALARNPASLSLFNELSKCTTVPQIVVAHSQGNLITSSALWALQAIYGSKSLENIQIRSVSSPSPAWPRGINHRIKVYGQHDDIVTLADPKNWTGNRSAGFWKTFSFSDPTKYVKSGTFAAHDPVYNIKKTSLYDRLRDDAGIAPFPKAATKR